VYANITGKHVFFNSWFLTVMLIKLYYHASTALLVLPDIIFIQEHISIMEEKGVW